MQLPVIVRLSEEWGKHNGQDICVCKIPDEKSLEI
jgi:hypothetical protein